MSFPDYTVRKDGASNLYKLLVLLSLSIPCKSLSKKDNKSLIVVINNLRLVNIVIGNNM